MTAFTVMFVWRCHLCPRAKLAYSGLAGAGWSCQKVLFKVLGARSQVLTA